MSRRIKIMQRGFMSKRISKCKVHGEFESVEGLLFGKLAWSRCPECVEEFEDKYEAEEITPEKEILNSTLRSAKIPERFKLCTLANYKAENEGQKKALEISKKYYNNFENIKESGSSLFYCGSYGTGKTHLAIAILADLIHTGKVSGMYTTTMRMLRDIRRSYSDKNLSEQDIIDKYVRCDLLVLDEIGVQMGTEAEKLLIYEVINGRYENYRPTILISNLSYEEMKQYMGARSIDRLKSKDGFMIVMDWESYRNK